MTSHTIGEAVDRYLAVLDDKRQLEAEVKKRSESLRREEATLLEIFGEHGVDSIKRGGRTIYLTTKTQTKLLVHGALAASQAIDLDLSFLATLNHQRLKSWITEQAESEPGSVDPLSVKVPKELDGIVSASKVPAIGCRKAT